MTSPTVPVTQEAEAGRSPDLRIQNQSGPETKQHMVAFSCNPYTQELRQKNCQEFEASLGYINKFNNNLGYSETLSQKNIYAVYF